jgi:hypothetical protein
VASVAVAALLGLVGASLFPLSAAAQSSRLRGALEETGLFDPDAEARRGPASGSSTSQAIDGDLLGLGEAGSPLAGKPTSGGGVAGPDGSVQLDRIGGAPTPAAAPATARRAAPARVPVAPVGAASAPPGTSPVGATPPIRPTLAAPNPAAEEAETEDPAYAPLGIRGGGMVWYPAIEATIGHKSNVDSASGGRSSSFGSVAPELVGRSDWSRHALELQLRGTGLAYPAASELGRTEYEARATGRLDLGDEMRSDLGANWSRKRESTSVNEATTAGVGTDRVTWGATAGLTRDVGFLGVSLRGAYERNEYVANAALGAGSTDPSVQNNSLWTGALRATVGPTRSIAPFVEARVTTRRYDEGLVYGQRRDSDGGAAVVGVAADAGPILRGEIATGWGVEKPRDGALPTMSGWLVEGKMTWSPTRLVVVRTKLASTFEPTTNSGSPGALRRSIAVDLDYALRRDLTASFGVGLDTKHYYGIDIDERTAAVSTGLTYKFDRNFQTFVRARFERTTTSNAAAYDVTTVTAGVRVQR